MVSISTRSIPHRLLDMGVLRTAEIVSASVEAARRATDKLKCPTRRTQATRCPTRAEDACADRKAAGFVSALYDEDAPDKGDGLLI